jgi:nucleotide-binding universal stress UspA family protein
MVNTETARTAVVVGVDGSDGAAWAAEWAAGEAFRRGVPLVVVHALSLPEVSMVEPSEYAVQARAQGQRLLDAVVARLLSRQPYLEVETLLSDLSAMHALHELSGRSALVVTGDRGHGGFPGLAVGSVSRRLAAHAGCPLVVVRGERSPRAASNEIVVGVAPDEANAPLEFAFAAAERHGALLLAARAWRPYGFRASPTAAVSAGLPQAREEQTDEVDALLRPIRMAYPQVDNAIMAWRGNPVPVLAEAAHNARMLVVGAHRHHGPFAVGAGYVVDGVLAHCPVPVAVVPIDEPSAREPVLRP